MTSTTLGRLAAAIPLAIGIGTTIAPRQILRLYGLPADQMTGPAEFGWRLFGVRNIVMGGAALAGHQQARDVALAIQAPDQAIFLHAMRNGSIPRLTGVLAMATSGSVVALSLGARRA